MPAPSESVRPRPQKTLYGRRKGPKLSAHQAALVETLLPRLQLHLRGNADPESYFGESIDDVWLEIGFGAGEHLLWQAEHHPKIGIIGAEPYASGMAKLLSKLYVHSASLFPSPANPGLAPGEAGEVASGPRPRAGGSEPEGGVNSTRAQSPPSRPSGSTPLPLAVRSREREQKDVLLDPVAPGRSVLARIRLYTGDARDVLDALPDASLSRIFLLFPDPWPKKRHHKRRFVQMETLDALARVTKPGAEFRFASDDPAYVAWALERFAAHDAFTWLAQRPGDWLVRSPDWPITRYEQKALHGTPAFFSFQRRAKEAVPPLQSPR